MNIRKNKIKGYSLVEMLISLALISGVLILVGLVLTTMIKTSIMADIRTLARTESEFLAAIMQRNIENSIPNNIFLFKRASPYLLENGNLIVNESIEFNQVAFSGEIANEIHMLPASSDHWICIATGREIIEGREHVYIMRTAASTALISSYGDMESHASCFNPSKNSEVYDYLTYFNSEQVSISTGEDSYAFELRGVKAPSGNLYIQSRIGVSPISWIGGTNGPLKPEYLRTNLFKTHSIR